MKRKRKRWVKTKDAEKDGKRRRKDWRGKKKNNGLEALLTEKLYLCVSICACWHKNNEKPILNNLEKKKPMNYKNDDKQPGASVFESLCYKQERNEELEM